MTAASVTLSNPDDPAFDFQHMMAHRTYFAIMGNHNAIGNLNQFSALPYLLDPSENTDQPATNWFLNHQQAHNDFNTALPSNYENGYYTALVTPPPTTGSGTGTSTGTTSLTITGATGTIAIGAAMTGTGVPAGTTIVSQTSGTSGGNGVYVTNQSTTLAAVQVFFSLSHPSSVQPVSVDAGSIGIPQAQNLLEGNKSDPENWQWWTFTNHQQHFTANATMLPLPTVPVTAPSNPWWWATLGPAVYPYW